MSDLSIILKLDQHLKGNLKNRISLNYTSMSKLSCDITYMDRASTGPRFVLAVTDEVTNYLGTTSLYRGTSYEVRDALIKYLFCQYAPIYV